jgi:hypothetical protein
MLATFFGGQFLAFCLGEIFQLFFTHRARHLPGSPFERCSGAFATFCSESGTGSHLLFPRFRGHI